MEEKKIINILVVDDEPVISHGICYKIGRLKHTVTYKTEECNNASRVLELIKQKNYDVIITDMKMPFLSGTSLIKKLRSQGYKGKIFALSGYDYYNYVREAFINGVDDYLLKPVAISDLDMCLRLLTENEMDYLEDEMEELEGHKNTIAYATEYIQKHYNNPGLTMREVANHVLLSYNHFSGLFKKKTGSTFPDYLRNLRIEMAIGLLNDPSMRMSDICYKVGFKYPQQFSNDFKKVTGLYPTEYKKNAIEGNRVDKVQE